MKISILLNHTTIPGFRHKFPCYKYSNPTITNRIILIYIVVVIGNPIVSTGRLVRTPSCAPCASPPRRIVARCRPRNTRICPHCRNRCPGGDCLGMLRMYQIAMIIQFWCFLLLWINIVKQKFSRASSQEVHGKRENLPSPICLFFFSSKLGKARSRGGKCPSIWEGENEV